ncbi:hypothetical protein EST38_g2632 [Candolleomyces aberdarensis]|uniref:SAP domain-containing protein n=1 Tax=Candolleomyces aberdarensis TaxID=2316362 RepID=A0A4Q2DSE0_9AGAR|nr:hypothetical protein EST38_g2632 [Candolleomyces aberdarensis]
MASTTTQILFNSPALHSLKRDQLVKLCKIHSIKASGKNVDLIQKLKQHAQTLPKDDPLSIAVRGENNEIEEEEEEGDKEEETSDSVAQETDSSPVASLERKGSFMPRPSEGWEMVMDSIAEEDENSSSQGTVNSMKTLGGGKAGEFGTGSSKSSTVGSSIRALANSLGLKKGATAKSTVSSHKSNVSARSVTTVATRKDELEEHAMPYSSLPPADPVEGSQPVAFNPSRMSINGFLTEGETPLPGHALRPGQPAPSNARLSMGLGLGGPVTPTRPTTTIRLVPNRAVESSNNSTFFGTPQLKPFKTTFDLILGSPGPASPAPTGGIYPTLTFSDLPPDLASPSRPSQALSAGQAMEGVIRTPNPQPTTTAATSRTPDPFVFGSPLPQHRVSDAQFKTAAASVLEEMNKRLQDQGVDGVDTTIISRLHPGAANKSELESRPTAALPRPRGELKEKFEDTHQQEFQKMEGIDGYMKRRADRGLDSAPVAGKKRKSSVLAPSDAPVIRRPIGAPRPSGTRVVSNGRLPRAIPGAFGVDEDDDDEPEEQTERAGKRIRVVSDASTSNEGEGSKAATEEEEKRAEQEKERQAIRRKLDMNKAKRRSSAANGGMHGRRSGRLSGRVSIAPKPKPSRFGFLSSAKSLVQSVWNRGKPANTAVATSSAIPKPKNDDKTNGPNRLVKKPSVAKPSTTMATASSSRVAPEAKSTEIHKGKSCKQSHWNTDEQNQRSPRIHRHLSKAIGGWDWYLENQFCPCLVDWYSPVFRKDVGHWYRREYGDKEGFPDARSTTSKYGHLVLKALDIVPTFRPNSKLSSKDQPLLCSWPQIRRRATPIFPSHQVSSCVSEIPSSFFYQVPCRIFGEVPSRYHFEIRRPEPFSPIRGKIFSTPLGMPSGIPTPVVTKKSSVPPNATDDGAKAPAAATTGAGATRQRSLNGRKPRISRSKVIARLASQRAASGSSSKSGSTVASSITPKPSGKTRSSLGAKVKRSSLGGAKLRASGGGDALMSAKKRARQSEYHMRRRSRVEALMLSPQRNAMDVDE